MLVPEDGKLRVEIRGALASILSLCAAGNTKGPSVSAEALGVEVKMVAGKRNHRELTPIIVVC
jgi:hypothetical protein